MFTTNTILFEIITFKIQKSLIHVTAIAKKMAENHSGELFPITVSLLKEQGNCNCNENQFEDPPKTVMQSPK